MKTKLSIVKCNSYNPEEIHPAVRKAFELLGGMGSLVTKGQRVLIKPNILSPRPPEHGVNTHIEVIRACARLIKECGAIPLIGDNPGGSVRPKEAYDASGVSFLAKEEGIELLDVKNVRMVTGLPVASYFFECDRIISLPKMKTHSLMGLTGAVKNMYGAVTGLNKSQCHKKFPRPEEFVNVLVDVFASVKPQFVLMDGVIAMDGDGPNAGTLKDVGLLIAGYDSVAIDSVVSHLIGIDPFSILTTKEAYRRGLGEADLERIEIRGETLEENRIKGFRLPRPKIVMKLPNPLVKVLASLVNFGPYINETQCKKCKICSNSCPVSAISIEDKLSRIDNRICVRCMCCHEVCPYGAIDLKRNILAKMFEL